MFQQFLHRINPELAHRIALGSLGLAYRFGGKSFISAPVPNSPRSVMGLNFPNPVGLAAGLDKNGEYIDALGALGFGFVEIGTITPRPQPGNPKPRLFRLPEAQAIINRMGFNNKGVDYLVTRAGRSKFKGILGINIGKNAGTPLEKATDDYLAALRKVYTYAEYVVVNISSPNTPNLRSLQSKEVLSGLLGDLKAEQGRLANKYNRYVPLVIKIAPDLTNEEIINIATLLRRQGMDGVIATNTTVSREGVQGLANADQEGGLSGAPLTRRSTEVIKLLHTELKGALPIIASGGVMSAEDAVEKIRAGASLVQIYTGFVYRGPALIREIVEALDQLDIKNEIPRY